MPVPLIENPALFWPANGPAALVALAGVGPKDRETGRPTSVIRTTRGNFVVDAEEVFDLSPFYGRFVPHIGTA